MTKPDVKAWDDMTTDERVRALEKWRNSSSPQTKPDALRHQWNEDGERCLKCGTKDWMDEPCRYPDANPPQSHRGAGSFPWGYSVPEAQSQSDAEEVIQRSSDDQDFYTALYALESRFTIGQEPKWETVVEAARDLWKAASAKAEADRETILARFRKADIECIKAQTNVIEMLKKELTEAKADHQRAIDYAVKYADRLEKELTESRAEIEQLCEHRDEWKANCRNAEFATRTVREKYENEIAELKAKLAELEKSLLPLSDHKSDWWWAQVPKDGRPGVTKSIFTIADHIRKAFESQSPSKESDEVKS